MFLSNVAEQYVERFREDMLAADDQLRAKQNERSAYYRATHRSLLRALASRRRDWISTQTPNLSSKEKTLMASLYSEAKRLSRDLNVIHHVDHIIPLAKGGLHHPENMCVILGSVNMQKGSKLPLEIPPGLLQLHRDFYEESTWLPS